MSSLVLSFEVYQSFQQYGVFRRFSTIDKDTEQEKLLPLTRLLFVSERTRT